MTEAQKKLNPYKKFKQELQARVQVRQTLAEIMEKLGTAELEIEKAAMMTQIAGKGQMPEDEIRTCEETTKVAAKAVSELERKVKQCGKSSDAAVSEEIEALKKSAQETK